MRLLLQLLRLLSYLPWRWQLGVGGLLGDLMWIVLPRRRHIVAVNLQLALPELTPTERAALLRESFRNAGRALIESAISWWWPDERLQPLLHWHGLTHLQQAQQSGRPIILLTGHFTSYEIGSRALSSRLPFHFLYKEQRNNPYLEQMTLRYRHRHYLGAIKHHDMRTMVKVLKRGEHCWYAPDQDFGHRHSVFADFMGVPTATVTALSRLARLSGAVVLPYVPLRSATGYDIYIDAPLDNFPTADEVVNAAQINHFLSRYVSRQPAHYLWLHRRFRSRPNGADSPYES
ncbi:lipid A biosynthesis acyltransferase [Ectothiorhodospiraceae bacterium BW-2]|nr:lipid A biosynthesis acyltransferase [Ectothiorhodospiraceae bacterium BW-2]